MHAIARDTLQCLMLALCMANANAASPTAADPQRRLMRICADPNNLPFSNQRQEGFENRIAQLIADELHADIVYTWRQQARGFVRTTLDAGHCDVIMGVPTNDAMVDTTPPYYRSSYVFLYKSNTNLHITSFDDAALRNLKIGVHAVNSEGANPPPAYALAARGLAGNVVGYTMRDVTGVESPARRLVDAVGSGEIDIAVVWGPFAGYFSQHQDQLIIQPVGTVPTAAHPIPFEYSISVGVRKGDTGRQQTLAKILADRQVEVTAILEAYGVPLVPVPESGASPSEREPARL